ncbi:CLUMA_CG002849, isoform A [Clunio marinus]|uniref:CLUMA_CG002849, isoform A n=1 Tax=Clunio marinus TaxID=568069 RepID=A0A1J1HLT8_9DIPT|nr:CLUMA_CG002849, isoform A [Clunio marinus]
MRLAFIINSTVGFEKLLADKFIRLQFSVSYLRALETTLRRSRKRKQMFNFATSINISMSLNSQRNEHQKANGKNNKTN